MSIFYVCLDHVKVVCFQESYRHNRKTWQKDYKPRRLEKGTQHVNRRPYMLGLESITYKGRLIWGMWLWVCGPSLKSPPFCFTEALQTWWLFRIEHLQVRLASPSFLCTTWNNAFLTTIKLTSILNINIGNQKHLICNNHCIAEIQSHQNQLLISYLNKKDFFIQWNGCNLRVYSNSS